jgi:hypothetical protein
MIPDWPLRNRVGEGGTLSRHRPSRHNAEVLERVLATHPSLDDFWTKPGRLLDISTSRAVIQSIYERPRLAALRSRFGSGS